MIFLGVVLGIMAYMYLGIVYCVYKEYKKQATVNNVVDETKLKSLLKNDLKRNILYVVGGIILAIFAMACLKNGFTQKSSTHSKGDSLTKGEPWRDLGTSEKEYMDTYKYIKKHGTK